MNRHGSMNRIYRLVWSAVRNVWIPVAETARGRGKRSSPALVAAALSLTCAIAQGSPSGGQVVAGTGSITQSGAITTITQATQNLSLTWANFNIAPQQTVNFVQPSTSAIAVNRILGTNGTQILGYLHANGQVFLINPNGIVFGPTAEVNVGGLVASTLDLEADTGNTKSFSGTGTGSVVNQGTITAAQGGYVALLGNHVSNEGVISAQLGTVALGAGSAITVTFGNNSRLQLQIDQSVLNSLAENGGLLHADGGQVIMTAGARDTLLASAVNNTGVIEARSVDTHDGTITLIGGMTAGTVKVGGTLDASAPEGGNGGLIDTSAAHVEVAGDARVTTAARDGLFGSWLIDPNDFTVAASGGDVTGTVLSGELATTDITLLSSAGATAGSGNVNVNDAVTWSANTTLTLTASNNVNVNANITASGATAGLVINPNTGNGTGSSTETPSGTGTFNLTGASITLSGATPHLAIAGTTYTVINTLGLPGSTTATDLQGMNGNLAASYALGTNIDASATSAWNGGAGFTPVGSQGSPFAGTFDGLGHTISYLTINLPAPNVGLFGSTGSSAIVQNIGLVGGSVYGDVNVGGLIGLNEGTVRNSYASGSVAGGSKVGGLVGFNNGGALSNSHAGGQVSGSLYVGGLVGFNQYVAINDSYSTATVGGNSYGAGYNVGGLLGFNYHGAVNNSFATGAVSGIVQIGGLVGGSYASSISTSHATGTVTEPESNNAGSKNSGGLVGFNYGGSTITNSYATGVVTGTENVGGLVGENGLISENGIITNSYATGRVIGGGSSGAGYGYGNVGGLVGSSSGAITNSYAAGSVSGTGAMLGGLVGFNRGSITNSHAGIGSVNGTGQDIGGLVGYNYTGNNHTGTIANSYATGAVTGPSDVGGLVGYNAGVISSSHATGVTTGSYSNAGGLVGNNYGSGTITNSYSAGVVAGVTNVGGLAGGNTGTITGSDATGNVSSTNVSAGGLVGNNPGGAISNSYATGTVTGSSYVGGLVGIGSGPISSSHASGNVTSGGNYIGGLVGNFQSGTISNSHATGSVSGGSYAVGGLVGTQSGAITGSDASGNVTGTGQLVGGLVGFNHGSISDSHSSGAVTGAGTYVGGLVGNNDYTGTIDNSYATGVVSGIAEVGGLVGSNNGGAISNSYATGSVSAGAYAGGLVGSNAGMITTSHATGAVSVGSGPGAGGLVGFDHGPLNNTYATGAVSGGAYVGGLVGESGTEGTAPISNSYATGAVTGGASVGGLVGKNDLTITNSYATGTVRGTGTDVGGLVGTNGNGGGSGNYGTISNSYATGIATGASSNAGGLVGNNYGAISNSYATGRISAGGNVGGLVGNNQGTVMLSFWNDDVVAVGIGAGVTAGAQGLSTTGMMTLSNFASAGWNISASAGSGAVWRIYEGNTAPLLLSFLTPLTITAQNTTQTYTGTPVMGLTDASYSVSEAAISGHINLNNPYNGVVNVGTYGADLYSDQQGYDISVVNGMLTLTPATLTITATGPSKTYGQVNPTLTGTVTGFVGGDTLASATTGTEIYSTPATTTSNVGAYAVTAAGITANHGNYVFSFAAANATAFTITPATLTVSGEVAASRVYNGTADTTLTGGSLTGLVPGDTVTLTQSGHLTSPDAGSGVAVTATDALVGAGAGNYLLAEPTDITANITPATLTYTAAAASFTAGQTPSGLSGTLTGFVAGETQLTATTGSLTWITTAGADSAPGRYAIDGNGLTAANYVFVDAPADATALTLLTATVAPFYAQNVVTSIEANLPSSQTDIQLAMLDIPTTSAVIPNLDVDASVASDSTVLDERSVHRAMVPSLRVVRGGVRLPADALHIDPP